MEKLNRISKEKLLSLIEKGAILINISTQEQTKTPFIKGSINIPLSEIEDEITRLTSQNKPIVFYSVNGTSSSLAVSKLADKNFDIYDGGLLSDILKYTKTKNSHDSFGQRNMGDFYR